MIDIKGFLETSFVDWPGKICSVLFLPACNFRCPYCHNHPLVLHPDQLPSISWRDILVRLQAFRGWVDGICLTGGEPTVHAELPVFIREIRANGFLVKLDTNGSNPKMLEALMEKGDVDFIAMDVKAPLDPFPYSRSSGVAVDLDAIKRSIGTLKAGKIPYVFRMTVVPGLHAEEDVLQVGRQLRVGQRLTLQNFSPDNPLDPSLKRTVPYDSDVLKRMEKAVQALG